MPTIELTLISHAISGRFITLSNTGHAWEATIKLQYPASPDHPAGWTYANGTDATPSGALAAAEAAIADSIADSQRRMAAHRAKVQAENDAQAAHAKAAVEAIFAKNIKPKPVLEPIKRRI